jgi:hypothetical protein
MVVATQTVRADWAVRIGIDFGPVSAGIMGKRQFQFDVWGDTVNTAARIEEYGRPAASMSAAAPGCSCAIGHRAARWDLLTSRARRRLRGSNASGCENDYSQTTPLPRLRGEGKGEGKPASKRINSVNYAIDRFSGLTRALRHSRPAR